MKRRDCIAGLSAVAASVPRIVRAESFPTVRALYEPIDTATAIFAGREMGIFKKAGIAVDLKPLNTGSEMIASAVSGSADVVVANVLSTAEAIEKGVPIRVVASNAVYDAKSPSTLILVEGASAISTAADLNGKTVAVNVLHGLAWIAAKAWIDKNGGNSKSVHFVEMPFPSMPAALRARRVDAVVVAEPALSIARPNSRVLAPAYSAIASTFPLDAWSAPTSWIAANRDTARRFASAMRDACAWANANHDKSAEIAATFMKLRPDAIRSRSRARFAAGRGFDTAQPLLDAGASYAVIKPIRARDLLAAGITL